MRETASCCLTTMPFPWGGGGCEGLGGGQPCTRAAGSQALWIWLLLTVVGIVLVQNISSRFHHHCRAKINLRRCAVRGLFHFLLSSHPLQQ